MIKSIKIVGGLNPNIVIEFSLQYSEIRSDLDYFTLNLGKIEKPQNKISQHDTGRIESHQIAREQ